MTAQNDITGDLISTKTVSEKYRDNWDSIFGGKSKKEEYELGDTVYYACGQDDLVEGRIVHKFMLHPNQGILYVVETPTHIDPVYEVRDWETLSSNKEGPLNWTKYLNI